MVHAYLQDVPIDETLYGESSMSGVRSHSQARYW